MDFEKNDMRSLGLSSSGMPGEARGELRRARWAVGLGFAALVCGFFAFVPALLVGWPLMHKAQNPEVKGRARRGLLLGSAMLLLHLALVLGGFFAVLSLTRGEAYQQKLREEARRLEQHIREGAGSLFEAEDSLFGIGEESLFEAEEAAEAGLPLGP